ncbi:hypothetical protein H6F71_00245 [Microcoleus sp. FACHB-61]|nr:hypothetical protein [Microcoleus sp. FACHB-61]
MNHNGFDYAVRIIKRWNSSPQTARRFAIACFARFFKNASSQKNFFKSGNLGYHSILPQSPVNTQYNRGLFGVGGAAINPQFPVNTQANRGFSAGTFETTIGGAA